MIYQVHHSIEKYQKYRRLSVDVIYYMIKILMIFFCFTVPPLGVEIVRKSQAVSSGSTAVLECRSWGSHPPAEVSWWRDQTKLQHIIQAVSKFQIYFFI